MSAPKIQLTFAGIRDRLGALAWMRTIQSRLYLALGLTAGMTVIGSLFALFASANIGATLTQIVSRSMPATIESFRLSEDMNNLVASAPRLIAVQDERHRAGIAAEIGARSRKMQATIAHLRALDATDSDQIAVAQKAMDERLEVLSQAVADRITISDQRRALVVAVRKSHENLLEAITPAIDDANFDLMTKSQASESRAELNQSIDGLRRLLEVQADANLLAGLFIEASMVTDIANLPPIRDLIGSAERDIDNNLKAFPDSEQRSKIAALYGKLSALAGDYGIVVQRTNELKGDQSAQQVYSAALTDAGKLKTAVESLIAHQGTIAQALSARAISQIKLGQIILSVLSIAALVAAGLIAWLYVGRNIVGRLTLLSAAMRRIAAGEANVSVPAVTTRSPAWRKRCWCSVRRWKMSRQRDGPTPITPGNPNYAGTKLKRQRKISNER